MSMSESGLTDKSILVGLSILDKKSDEEKAAII
jgi:hypothetical protein